MTAVQAFDGGASAAAVKQHLNDAIANYGRIADELAELGDDPFGVFEREVSMAELVSAAKQAATCLGLAVVRHVTSGGSLKLDPEPPAVEAISPALATDDEVSELVRKAEATEPAPLGLQPRSAPHVWLQRYLDSLGEPRCPAGDIELLEDTERLEHLTRDEARADWNQLRDDNHAKLVEVLVAWTRGLQSRCDGSVVSRVRVDNLFRRLADHRRERQPGFVFGLKLTDRPRQVDWFAEARHGLECLREYAFTPHVPACSAPGARSGTRRRNGLGARSGDIVDPELRARTSGLRAVILGGNARPERRDVLKEAFGFAELDWVETEHSNAVAQLAARVRGRTVDLVIALRFRKHKDSRKLSSACEAAGVPLAEPFGYGVAEIGKAVAEALEWSRAAR